MINKNTIILFDLDNTLIATDSMKILVLFLMKKNYFNFILKLPMLIYYSFTHIISNSTHKTQTKSKFYCKLLEGFNKKQIDTFSIDLAKYIFINYKNLKIYRILKKSQKLGIKNYIVTASADFYCKPLAKLFNTKLISTKVNMKKFPFGEIIGKNCYGEEKKKRVLKEVKYFKTKYSIFYSDSHSDHPLASICNKSYLIK